MYIHVEATYNVGERTQRNGESSPRTIGCRLIKTLDNTAPEFPSPTVDRRVMENSKDAIGAPITATDADGDVRHYSITDATAGDNGSFTIGKLTGELKASGTLDFDNPIRHRRQCAEQYVRSHDQGDRLLRRG